MTFPFLFQTFTSNLLIFSPICPIFLIKWHAMTTCHQLLQHLHPLLRLLFPFFFSFSNMSSSYNDEINLGLRLPRLKPRHHLLYPLQSHNFIPLSLFLTLGIIFLLWLTLKLIATTHGQIYFAFMLAQTGWYAILCLQITSLHRMSLTSLITNWPPWMQECFRGYIPLFMLTF